MALTDVAIRKSKPREKPYKLSDARGMFLLVHPSGSKYWRLKYRFASKEKVLALGVYPEVTLAEARERRDAARKQLSNGIDPSALKKISKLSVATAAENTLETLGREWFAKFSKGWAPTHADSIIRRLERDVFPWLGARPISEISAKELYPTLARIEKRGAIETAHRALQNCSQIFRYAVLTGRAHRDPSVDLRGALTPVKASHHASITEPKAVGELLRAIQGYKGSLVTKIALSIAPLVFVRPGELRRAEWSEFDLEATEWRIPAGRMKMGEQHIVPLSTQVITHLMELKPLTGEGRFVFPGSRSSAQPMSNNTITAALRRLGYTGDEMTAHGFRSMASTLLNEQGWHPDAIERQLAHGERNSVRAADNFAEHLPERRRMMQVWADYLDSLVTSSGNV